MVFHRSPNTMRLLTFLSALLLPLIVLAGSEGPVSASFFGVAIGGKDTVAYHGQSGSHDSAEGSKEWVHEWRGAEWRFTSQENYDKFRADPERYRPAYGGHCANALALGEGLIPTNGNTWEIFDDRLFLFFAPRGRERWLNGDRAAYHAEADRAWREITGHDD